MIRTLIQKFNRSMSERRASVRYSLQVPLKIWFEPDAPTAAKIRIPTVENLFISGKTLDVSRSGIAFLVPSIRIKENYLVGGCSTRKISAELDLPNGRARMQIVGRRYEQVGEHLSVSRYLIGASITHIEPEDLEIYECFLRPGIPANANGGFEFGIDKS